MPFRSDQWSAEFVERHASVNEPMAERFHSTNKSVVDRYSVMRIRFPFDFRRDGRVVECGGLENRCTERYRGFESLSLRHF